MASGANPRPGEGSRQTISPATRKRLQLCFERANKLMAQQDHDYAHELFTQCVLGDPGNIFYYSDGKLDPVDDAKTVHGLVRVGMCVKDFQMKDKDGTPTRDVQLTPGTGRVDFARVLRILRAGGFRRGYLVIECLDPGDGTPQSLLHEAKKARKFCQQVVASL